MLSKSRKHFLIVENDQNDAILIRRAFATISHEATSFVCRNTSEAKAYLRGAGMYANRHVYPLPHGIITDLRMDGETGFELVDWLGNETELKGIPVALLSGSGSAAEMAMAATLPIQAVYKKPHRLDDLTSLLRKFAELATCDQEKQRNQT